MSQVSQGSSAARANIFYPVSQTGVVKPIDWAIGKTLIRDVDWDSSNWTYQVIKLVTSLFQLVIILVMDYIISKLSENIGESNCGVFFVI